MRTMVIAGIAATLCAGVAAWADEVPVMPTPKVVPNEVHVKIQAPPGTSDEDIANGIAAEHARRDPEAQEAARVAKERAAADEAHHARVAKICDSIPEESLAKDPSLRKMCGE